MIKQNKIQELKEVIIKQIPSILDLVFGCRIENEEGFFRLDDNNLIQIHKGTKHEINFLRDEKLRMYKKQIMKDEIIGRDITLSDCLLALKIDEIDGSEEKDFLSKIQVLVSMWNKYDNNLNKQSQPTIDFLYKLICEIK